MDKDKIAILGGILTLFALTLTVLLMSACAPAEEATPEDKARMQAEATADALEASKRLNIGTVTLYSVEIDGVHCIVARNGRWNDVAAGLSCDWEHAGILEVK